MKRVKNCFSVVKLVILYKTYVQPILQYGILVYGTANISELKKNN